MLISFLLISGCTSASAQPDERQARLIEMAKAGDVEAMYQIFFDVAQKVSPEHHLSKEEISLAKYWLDKAGENNSWRAAFVLQLCYENGCWGYPINLKMSKHYQAIFDKYRPKKSLNGDIRQRASPDVDAR